MPIYCRIIIVYSNNILLSNENNEIKTTKINMEECLKNNVEQSNPDTEEYIL